MNKAHVERDPKDDFSRQVFDVLRAGDAVTVLGPWGDFVLRADSPRPILFVASEAGFAPVKGLVEHTMSLDRAELLHLYWHAARPAGHYLVNLCRAWADALDNFRYTTMAGGGAGDIVARMARDHADLAAFDVYLAGPEAFVDGAAKALAQQGFPAAQLVATAT